MMLKSRNKIMGALSAAAMLSLCMAFSLPALAKAEMSGVEEGFFRVSNGTTVAGSVAAEDGTGEVPGIQVTAENGCGVLEYAHTFYIGDNTADDSLFSFSFDDRSIVRLEAEIGDAENPGKGFYVAVGRSVRKEKLTDDYYVSAGAIGETAVGYVHKTDGMAVADNDFVLDGTSISYSAGRLISLSYDAAGKDVYVTVGGNRQLVRSLDGWSDVTDVVDFDAFASGEATFCIRAYIRFPFLGRYYSEGDAGKYTITELDGKNVVNETEAKTYVLRQRTQAYVNTEYRLPMPESFDLQHGRQEAEGFRCTVKKMSQKPFNGEVTPQSGFVAETGTYTVTYTDPEGRDFVEYKLPTAMQAPPESEIVIFGEIPETAGAGERITVPAAATKNDGYLTGYSDNVYADITLNGQPVEQNVPADGKNSFVAERAGNYEIIFRAVDAFGEEAGQVCVELVCEERIYFEGGEPSKHCFVGGGVTFPIAAALEGGTERKIIRTLIRPDGTQVFSDDGSAERQEVLDVAGDWVLTLSAQSGEKTFSQTYTVTAYVKPSDLFEGEAGTEIYPEIVQRIPSAGDGTVYKGVGMYAENGSAFAAYAGEIYIADNTSEDCLLELMPLVADKPGGGKAGLKKITVHLADATDSSVYADIVIVQSEIGEYAYAVAGAAGQELLGINRNELVPTEGTNLPFGLADGGIAGASSYTGKYTSIGLYYDYETDCIYLSPYRFSSENGESVLVRNLRDPDFANVLGVPTTGVRFGGFSSGTVKISVTAESMDPEYPAGLMILNLDGQSFDSDFGRVKENAAPAGMVVSDNLVLGEKYTFPVPDIYDVLEPGLAFTGEYSVLKNGREVYRGSETGFVPEETGTYTVFYLYLKDGYGAAGADFSCSFTVVEKAETGMDFVNPLFSEETAQDFLTVEGIEVGAVASSNLNRDGSVPLTLNIYRGEELLKTFEGLSGSRKFLFPNSGEYRLEYAGIDCKGNEIVASVRLQVNRIRAELTQGNTVSDKWVLGEKRAPFVIERKNISVTDGLWGNISDSAEVMIGISVKFNGEELFAGDSYAFGNSSEKGEYLITYTVRYTTDGVVNESVITRRVVISDDDVAPVITGDTDRISYKAGDGTLLLSSLRVQAEDNKDENVTMGAFEFSFGDRNGDCTAEDWLELPGDSDLAMLFDRAGTYTLRMTATDAAGNVGYLWIPVDAIDYSAPVIRLQVPVEEIEGARVIEKLSEKSTSFKVLTGAAVLLPEAEAEDIGFSRTECTVIVKRLNGREEIDCSDLLDGRKFTAQTAGKYIVEYRAEDTAGFTDKIVFIFDVRDYWLEAELESENPATATTGRTIGLSGVIVTDYSGQERKDVETVVLVRNGDKTVYEGEKMSFVAEGVGTYTISYIVRKDEEEVRVIRLMTIVDGIAPVIKGELSGWYQKGNMIDVSGFTATDDEDGELSVTVIVRKDGQVVDVKDGKFKATSGVYEVTVIARDYTGNVTEKNFTVKPVLTLLAAIGGAVVLLAAIGAVTAIIFIKRRNKKCGK